MPLTCVDNGIHQSVGTALPGHEHSRSAGSGLHPVDVHIDLFDPSGRSPGLHLKVISTPSSGLTNGKISPLRGGVGTPHPAVCAQESQRTPLYSFLLD